MTSRNHEAPGTFHVPGQTIVSSSGRHVRTERGVFGISPLLEVYQGDSGVMAASTPFLDDNAALSCQECIELADRMLGLWHAFKDMSLGTLRSRCLFTR